MRAVLPFAHRQLHARQSAWSMPAWDDGSAGAPGAKSRLAAYRA